MLTINTNLSSLIAQSSMKSSTNKLNQAIERMTTGFKINHAKDNAANYSISTNMTTKIGAYDVAEDNAAMGLDLISTAEGTLSQIEDKLQRLRALAEQASNGTYGEQSLNAINAEANALVDEINRLYSTAEYNGLKLFGGESVTTTASVYESSSISTLAIARSTMPETQASGFMKEIAVRDTSTMTALSTQVSDSDLADGTYSITTTEEMVQLATMTNAGHISENDAFVLGNNIYLSLTSWSTISTSFDGVFDGNGYHIILPDRSTLFDHISGTIKNVSVEGAYCGTPYAAILAWEISASAIIQNVSLKNTATTNCGMDRSATGIASSNYGLIEDCYVEVDFSDSSSESEWYNSALVGDNYGILKNCTAVANGATAYLVHYNMGTIDSCYGTFNDCSSPTLVIGASGTITNCYILDASNSIVESSADWDGIEYTYSLVSPNYTISGSGSGPGGGGVPAPAPPGGGTGGLTSAPDTIVLQVGVASDGASQIGVNTSFVLTGVDDLRMIGLDLTTDYLTQIDDMLGLVSEKQTHFGATSNRLESVLEEITIQRDNLVSSRSTIRDADIAEVSSHYIQQQILQQASATLLATANQSPSIALQLI